ncbi:hypothetical protein BTT_20610 [Bacillus thuringiensis serovar morrisoni str. 4AA1]|nr:MULTISPECIES: hypothetical protein [Bacillus]AJQ58651.1 hypothetical protein SD98_10190 [Bacillus thuringiensis serovar morrisoni]MED3098631.1 hypothetical protein [Bacillus thuringiensis]MRA95332.1 hypothetical protein [Bacillus thuringiensis]OTY41256.1 hypothetical protein BK736_11545 [Bacillus thuringiensis serovar poloniensis]RNG53039.1 hypothetical protein EEL55_09680 [Bacillus thuringiensis]
MKSPYDFYITPDEYERAERNGINRRVFNERVRNLGWDKVTAMTKPVRGSNPTGWCKVREIALKNGIRRQTYYARMKKGWNLIDAISKPPINKYQALRLAEEANYWNGNKVLSDEQAKIASLNGVSYRLARERIKRLKWPVEEAITTPVLTKEECGKRGKEASYWCKL